MCYYTKILFSVIQIYKYSGFDRERGTKVGLNIVFVNEWKKAGVLQIALKRFEAVFIQRNTIVDFLEIYELENWCFKSALKRFEML